jgi:opacity protein-like surface antigen
MKVARMTLLAALAATVSVVGSAQGQAPAQTPIQAPAQRSYLAGGYFTGGFPMGDWGKIAGFGLGIDATNVTYLSSDKPWAVRSNFGLLYNFSRTTSVPEANLAPNSKLDLETKNTSLFFGIGPEFSRKKGDTSPFLFGTVGFDTYWTKCDLTGTAGGSPYSSKNGDSRISFAWSAGLGLRKHVSPGETIELSAEYRSGLEHKFVIPDQVTGSGTSVTVNRDSHSSDQILIRIGTLLGY